MEIVYLIGEPLGYGNCLHDFQIVINEFGRKGKEIINRL